MPPAEVEISVDLIHGLLRDQNSDLAGLEIRLLAFGWDNVSFRLGEEFVVRLPRRQVAVDLISNEARWLPPLAPILPLPVPAPLFVGLPGRGFPWPWSIVPYIPGAPVATGIALDLSLAADQLGSFLRALHITAPPQAPENPYRGIPLVTRDVATRDRIRSLQGHIDSRGAMELWEKALITEPFTGSPIWLHGDLHTNNILAHDGRISGVIDFGDITAGDPATDLAVGWMMFPPTTRDTFRKAYGASGDATWDRAAGWALSLATAYLAHSADNPIMHSIGVLTLQRLLSET